MFQMYYIIKIQYKYITIISDYSDKYYIVCFVILLVFIITINVFCLYTYMYIDLFYF